MRDLRRRSWTTITALLLFASLTLVSCGNSSMDEANQLNQSVSEDKKEIERLAQENRVKESQITAALNAKNYDAARRLLDDTVKAVDQALQKGQSAADKLDKASKLNLDQTIKQYLSFRAQSVNKAIEAFKELREGIVTFRDSIGSTDKAATNKAQNELQQSVGKFEEMINESQKMESQADEIARSNPDKIKPGR
jgi:Mg2+ and Co2+ transporter CorA